MYFAPARVTERDTGQDFRIKCTCGRLVRPENTAGFKFEEDGTCQMGSGRTVILLSVIHRIDILVWEVGTVLSYLQI